MLLVVCITSVSLVYLQMNLEDCQLCLLFSEFPVSNIVTNDHRYYTVTLRPAGLHFDDWLPTPGHMFILFFLHGKGGMNECDRSTYTNKLFVFFKSNSYVPCPTLRCLSLRFSRFLAGSSATQPISGFSTREPSFDPRQVFIGFGVHVVKVKLPVFLCRYFQQ
jgi:hypothetical protein